MTGNILLLFGIAVISGIIAGAHAQSCFPACTANQVCQLGVCLTRSIPVGGACQNVIPRAMRRRRAADPTETCADLKATCQGGVCTCPPGYSAGGPGNMQCVQCPAGMTYNGQFHACYALVTRSLGWDDAQANCKTQFSQDSHLVEIQTSAKQALVNQIRGRNPVNVGGRRFGTALHGFKWIHSRVGFTYRNWFSGQPDKKTTKKGPQTPANCLWSAAGNGEWFDTSCKRQAMSICEKYM